MLLAATRKTYPLTTLLYVLIAAHALVLIAGGTLELCPRAARLLAAGSARRNPYDKIGHLMQGFVPALVAREILLRGAWVCAAGACALSLHLHRDGDQRQLRADRVGCRAGEVGQRRRVPCTQGDPWDTQSIQG